MSRFVVFLFVVALSIFYAASSMAEMPSAEKKEKPAEQILIEKGGVLLPQGTLVLEPSLQYNHYSRNRISISGWYVAEAIVIGEIAVSDVKRDILIANMTARYGITPRFEAELKIPYHYRHDREVKGPGTADVTTRTLDDYGLGDIEGALYYHLITATGSVPDIVFNVRAKSTTGRSPYGLTKDAKNNFTELPTGSGHWGFSGGLTAVKASDPAVFFLSLGYFLNVEKDAGHGYGTIDPGDSVEYALGIAYALSEKLSLSTTYQQRFTKSSRQEGRKVPETNFNAATIFLGTSYALSKNSSLNLSVGFGLTVDAPNVQLTLSVPFRI
ncbi:MAG: transporter [Nitrospirae bacterium]|nr:transporter [Nitrospirota bacterium]